MTLTRPAVGSTGWGGAVNDNFLTLEQWCNQIALSGNPKPVAGAAAQSLLVRILGSCCFGTIPPGWPPLRPWSVTGQRTIGKSATKTLLTILVQWAGWCFILRGCERWKFGKVTFRSFTLGIRSGSCPSLSIGPWLWGGRLLVIVVTVVQWIWRARSWPSWIPVPR